VPCCTDRLSLMAGTYGRERVVLSTWPWCGSLSRDGRSSIEVWQLGTEMVRFSLIVTFGLIVTFWGVQNVTIRANVTIRPNVTIVTFWGSKM